MALVKAASASLVPIQFSSNFPNLYLPNTMLYPSENGNPGRKFNDQELGELAAENKAVLPYAIAMKTWAVNTDVLTTVFMPKIRLRDNVFRVEGKIFEYNIEPVQGVPPRGTVRFMSKEQRGFSLAISQKGIGSKFEGRALRSEYGPQLLAMEIQAVAESISLGMALNSAISLVNAATRYALSRHGPSFMLNLAQEQAREIGLWCRMGVDASRIATEVNRIITEENSNINAILVPSKYTTFVDEASLRPQEKTATHYTMISGSIVEVESKDKFVAINALNGGKVLVYVSPVFRYSKRVMDPLSTISRIGEIYPMYGEFDAEGKTYLKSSLDIYVYDEEKDELAKLKFEEAIKSSNWLDIDGDDYDPRLKQYVQEMNDNKRTRPTRPQLMFPIGIRSNVTGKLVDDNSKEAQYYLPRFIGNLDTVHLPEDDFNQMVSSVERIMVANGIYLSESTDDINNILTLRTAIEDEPYDAEYWKEVAALNINRSVQFDRASGRPAFIGQLTPQARCDAYATLAIREWVPNRFGALDFPKTYPHPAGLWSAGGLLTLSYAEGHPLQEKAQQAYAFFNTMAERTRDALLASVVFNAFEMPINMPKTDMVQLVMTACFGPRVPIFLAAPLELASAGKSKAAAVTKPVDRSLPLVSVVVLNDVDLAKVANQKGSAFLSTKANGKILYAWRSPSGAVLLLPSNLQKEFVNPKSPLFTQEALTELSTRILGEPYQELAEVLMNSTIDASVKNNFFAFLDRQVMQLEEKNLKTAVRVLGHISRLVATYKDQLGQGQQDAANKTFAEAVGFMTNIGKSVQAAGAAIKSIPDSYDNEFAAANTEMAEFIAEIASTSSGNADLGALVKAIEEMASLIKRDIESQAAAGPGKSVKNKFWAAYEVTSGTLPLWLGSRTTGSLQQLTANDLLAENRAVYTELDGKIKNLIKQMQPQQGESSESANMGAAGVDGDAMNVDTEATPSDAMLLSAKYYRTPLCMSQSLLETLINVETPWILPGDFAKKFADIAPVGVGIIDPTVYDLPHYAQSRSMTPSNVRTWSDTGIYSRTALVSGVYSAAAASGATRGGSDRFGISSAEPIRSRGPYLDAAYQTFHHAEQDRVAAQRPQVGPTPSALNELTGGGMESMLKYVHGKWNRNFVMRFAALAYLFMPLSDYNGLISMIQGNVMPPFGVYAWRLRSDHEVYSLLAAVAGIDTGANFYNGAHFDWAQDATRDVYQTRAVITTDAHVIRPENLRLISSVIPGQYRGGHNTMTVRSDEDLRGDNLRRMGSIIYTVTSLSAIRNKLSPLSFINMPPAEIAMVGSMINDPHPLRQYFAGSDYYCNTVFPKTFKDLKRKLSAISAPTVTYKNDRPEENHIAMNGLNIRFDYQQRHFCRVVPGNGHRSDIRLNLPGARAYLNGETTYLPAAKNVLEFLLN